MKIATKPLLLLFALATMSHAMGQLAVGKWRDHFSYNKTYRIDNAGDRIYCSASGALFYYDLEDYTVNKVSKTTILNDVGISTFSYDPQTHYLAIAYNNANLDFIKENKTYNIADIKRSNIGGDKSIHNIRFHNRNAYLACGFGIVVIDMARMEIKESFLLGNDGSYLNINDIAFTDNLIVAATDNGIIYADKNSLTLNIASSWQHDTLSLITGLRVTKLETDNNGHILALAMNEGVDTTVYVATSNLSFVPLSSGNIRNIHHANGSVTICHNNKIELFSDNLSQRKEIGDIEWLNMDVNDALITSNGKLWMAHSWAGMAVTEANAPLSVKNFLPPSPWTDNAYRVTSFDNRLLVSPGGHASTYANSYIYPDVYIFEDEKWSTLDDPDGIMSGISDIIDIAVNPRQQSTILATAWGGGLVKINGNKVTALYNADNTNGALVPYTSNGFTSLRTGSVAYDNKGSAWITNSLSTSALAVYTKDGNWQSFNTQTMTGSNEIDHIIWDSINDLKLFWGRANRIFVHDGKDKMAYIDPNNGAKLKSSTVSSLAQDHQGNIWVGTDKGIKVIYNIASALSGAGTGERSSVTCNNILYSENGINEYLLAYESVTSIVVDGANRKWIGTSTGGLYLLSSNGLEQLEHFTSANSPLLSDKILSLAIMPWTGELFIVTDKGMCSYRATATYAFDEPMDDIHAFPNPVRPDFDGVIAIKGFTRNGIVHITDAAGNVVYATTSNGGQAIWNGCTQSGKRVASGVYYVFASSDDGSMRSATKILIIR